MSSPFTDLKSDVLFGQAVTGFSCIQCKGPPNTFFAAMLKHDEADDHSSMVFAYALCTRCAALYWNEAGTKAFASLRDSLCE